jgi:hypothetical protein
MLGRRLSRRSKSHDDDDDDDDDNAVVYYADYDLPPPTKRIDSAVLNGDGRASSVQSNKINKKIIDLNSLKRKTPVEFDIIPSADGAAISTTKMLLTEELGALSAYDINPTGNYGLISMNSEVPFNSTSYHAEDTQNHNQFANLSEINEESSAYSNTKASSNEKNKKITAMLDRPAHWNRPSAMRSGLNKNTKNSKSNKTTTKNVNLNHPAKMSVVNPGNGINTQTATHPTITSVNSNYDVDSQNFHSHSVSFKPNWIPSAAAKKTTRNEKNEEIIDDATKFQFEPLSIIGVHNSSNLTSSPPAGATTQGYYGYGKASPPSSSHISKFKSGNKNIGHLREKLNRIIKHVQSDELRLSLTTSDSCNDPQDPRRKSCFWIDVSVEDLGNSADCKPFISANVRIRNIEFNEKQVVNRINQGKFRCTDMPSPSNIDHDLNSESLLFQSTENAAPTSLESNINQYTSQMQATFPINAVFTALFRDLKQRVQIDKIFRVYEPLKITNEYMNNGENNDLSMTSDITMKDAIICTNVMEECEYVYDENNVHN